MRECEDLETQQHKRTKMKNLLHYIKSWITWMIC